MSGLVQNESWIYMFVKRIIEFQTLKPIFLANSFVWLNNSRIGYLLCRHEKYTTLWPMQQVQCSKTWIPLKRNLQIDWKFGHTLILSISTVQTMSYKYHLKITKWTFK